MPYPDANAYAITTPSTSLDPRSNGLSGFIGNAHTGRATANGLAGTPMPPFAFNFVPVTVPSGAYLSRGADLTGTITAISRMTFAFTITPSDVSGVHTILQTDDGIIDETVRIWIETSEVSSQTKARLWLAVGSTGTTGMVAKHFVANFTPVPGQTYNVQIALNNTLGVSAGVVVFINGSQYLVDAGAPVDFWRNATAINLSGDVTNWRIFRGFSAANQFLGTCGLLYVVFGTTDAAYITDPTVFFNGGSAKEFAAGLGTTIPNPIILFGYDQAVATWQAGTARTPATGGNWTATGTFT
jgi:hypothetical protein